MKCLVLSVLLLAWCCSGLPVNKNAAQVKEKHGSETVKPTLDPKEYIRYLQELAASDPEFTERLNKVKNMDMAKLQEMIINHPHIRDRLMNSQPNHASIVRNQVEEAKRMTVEQMRQLQKLQTMRNDNLLKEGDWMTKKEAMRENLPANFGDKDIQAKLKEAQKKMEELDRMRKEEFKEQEMWEEHRRRQKLREMNEQQRLKAEAEYQKKHEELRKHERLPQPGSKEQLEQVWEEDDGMAKEEFDSKTFFHMHDTNADRVLDPMEVEALFYSELQKVYKDDMNGMEAHEDLARMREYAMSEIDKNHDGLISLDEFMVYAGEKAYEEKKEWHPVVDEDQFSDKEFEQFEDDYEEDYDYQYDEHGNIIGIVPKEKKKAGDTPHQDKPGDGGSPVPPQHHQGGQESLPSHHQEQPSPPQHQEQPSPPQHQGNQEPAPHQGVPDPSQRKGDIPPGVQVEDPNSIVINKQEEHHENRMAPPSPSHAPAGATASQQP